MKHLLTLIPSYAEAWHTIDWMLLVGAIAFVLAGIVAALEVFGDYFARRHP